MGNLLIEDRTKITVTEVADVDSFNETSILVSLKSGGLVIKGQNLHLQLLNLEEGRVIITGAINGAVYTEKKEKQEKSLLKKIFK